MFLDSNQTKDKKSFTNRATNRACVVFWLFKFHEQWHLIVNHLHSIISSAYHRRMLLLVVVVLVLVIVIKVLMVVVFVVVTVYLAASDCLDIVAMDTIVIVVDGGSR